MPVPDTPTLCKVGRIPFKNTRVTVADWLILMLLKLCDRWKLLLYLTLGKIFRPPSKTMCRLLAFMFHYTFESLRLSPHTLFDEIGPNEWQWTHVVPSVFFFEIFQFLCNPHAKWNFGEGNPCETKGHSKSCEVRLCFFMAKINLILSISICGIHVVSIFLWQNVLLIGTRPGAALVLRYLNSCLQVRSITKVKNHVTQLHPLGRKKPYTILSRFASYFTS